MINNPLRTLLAGFAVGGLLLAITWTVWAQSGITSPSSVGSYEISSWTVDGGGATFSTGSGYTLGGTIGQSDSGSLSNGAYTLIGGFWGAAESFYRTYLPVVFKDY